MDLRASILRAPAAIGVVDAKWRVRRVSRDIEGVLGYEPAECMGAGVFVAVHPDDLPQLLITVGHAIEQQQSASLELRLWHKQDTWTTATVLISPLTPGSPYPFGFVVSPPPDEVPDDVESRLIALEMRMRRIAREVEAVQAGDKVPARPDRLSGSLMDELSERQAQIVERLLRGRRVSAIAGELGISPSTVRNHLSALFRKFGVLSQAELIESIRGASDGGVDGMTTTK